MQDAYASFALGLDSGYSSAYKWRARARKAYGFFAGAQDDWYNAILYATEKDDTATFDEVCDQHPELRCSKHSRVLRCSMGCALQHYVATLLTMPASIQAHKTLIYQKHACAAWVVCASLTTPRAVESWRSCGHPHVVSACQKKPRAACPTSPQQLSFDVRRDLGPQLMVLASA